VATPIEQAQVRDLIIPQPADDSYIDGLPVPQPEEFGVKRVPRIGRMAVKNTFLTVEE